MGTFDLIFAVLYRNPRQFERSVWRGVGVGAGHNRSVSAVRFDIPGRYLGLTFKFANIP